MRDELATAKSAIGSARKTASDAAAEASRRLSEAKVQHGAAISALEKKLQQQVTGNTQAAAPLPPISLLSSNQGKLLLGLNVLLALTLLAVLRFQQGGGGGGGGRGGAKRAKQGEYME